jgi:prophage regulatory protein
MARPEFFLDPEVEQITSLRDPTRKRAEARGQFPRRIRISPRLFAWRRSDIAKWLADPEGWCGRNAKAAQEVQG